MDEVELVQRMAGPDPDPSAGTVAAARATLERAIDSPASRRAVLLGRVRRQGRNGLRKVALLAGVSTAAIMTQPHTPLGLPGHRALGWLSLLLMMRLVGGTGWASLVGLASAAGTMAIGRSPNGSVWGVLQYAVAGIGVDAFLAVRPQLARNPLYLAGLGALLLVLVGWITPISNSFVGGVPLSGIWVSIRSLPASGWARLLSFDFAFGAGAGLIGYAAGWVLNQDWRHVAERLGVGARS